MRWNAGSIPKHGKIWHQEDSHYMVPHFYHHIIPAAISHTSPYDRNSEQN